MKRNATKTTTVIEVSVEEQDKAVTAAVRIRTQAREYESDRKDTQTTYWPLYLRSFFFTYYPNGSEHKFATSKKVSRLLVKVEPSSRTPLIMHLTVWAGRPRLIFGALWKLPWSALRVIYKGVPYMKYVRISCVWGLTWPGLKLKDD